MYNPPVSFAVHKHLPVILFTSLGSGPRSRIISKLSRTSEVTESGSQRIGDLIIGWSGGTSLGRRPMSKDPQKPSAIPPPDGTPLPSYSAPTATLSSSLFPTSSCLCTSCALCTWRTKDEAQCTRCRWYNNEQSTARDERWDNHFGLMWSEEVLGRYYLSKMLCRFPPPLAVFNVHTSWIHVYLPFCALGRCRVWVQTHLDLNSNYATYWMCNFGELDFSEPQFSHL